MIKKLLHAIEQQTGLNMQHNHDFVSLSQLIFERLHASISDSTLKRLWGYVDPQNVKPRTNTLNILAEFLGCENFEGFCNMGGVKEGVSCKASESVLSFAPIYTAKNLAVNEELVARWKPNRRCVFKHLEANKFEVVKSENNKLCVGDTFCCDYFIEGEIMQLCHLTHQGVSGLSYVAGKKGGVKYERRMPKTSNTLT